MITRLLRYWMVAGLLALLNTGAYAAEGEFVIIGTGGVTGVYYPAGGAICRMVNRDRDRHGLRCAVESTQGSVSNIRGLQSGELDMAVVQSDMQEHAVAGTEAFADMGAQKQLRALFTLHSELFTLLARKDSRIATLEDLKGKRINIGSPGSGQRATMDRVMQALKWQYSDFLKTFEYASAEQADALCRDRFDAMVFVAGHPSGAIKEATIACDSVLIPVQGEAIDALVSRYAYYQPAAIPAGMYRNSEQDVATFGLAATFIATERMTETTAYHMVKAVFENFDAFTRLHPAFHHLQREAMAAPSQAAPTHPGALKYFKEAGLR